MARRQAPLFLERASYRRRRMTDALRLIVFLGFLMWMIPVVWPTGSGSNEASVPMSHALFYIFGVWVLLIALAFLLASKLREPGEVSGDDP